MISDTKEKMEKSAKNNKKQQKEFISGMKDVTAFYEKITAPGQKEKTEKN